MLARTLFALRQACSAAAPLATRSFSVEAAAAEAPVRAAADAEGVKRKLMRILGGATEPLTSDQVWQAAQVEGLPSKRFTKRMLQQLKQAGLVVTKPAGGHVSKKHGTRNFVYRLSQTKQEQRQARPQAGSEGSSSSGGGGGSSSMGLGAP
ncbi:hypothetical protein ABPG77_003248 [Micractinium sp. CCAP 211/92]